MLIGKSVKCSNPVVYFRIMFHGTAAKGIHTGIHAEVHSGQAVIMANHVHLAHIRHGDVLPAHGFRYGIIILTTPFWYTVPVLSFFAFIKYGTHHYTCLSTRYFSVL